MNCINVWCDDKKVSVAGGDLHDAPPCNTGGFENYLNLTGDKKLNNYGIAESSNLTQGKAVIYLATTIISIIVLTYAIIYLINYPATI